MSVLTKKADVASKKITELFFCMKKNVYLCNEEFCKYKTIMTLREVTRLLNGQVLLGENRLDEDVTMGFASDLMSEVLTLKDTPMLITGLCNMQTIRTCDMANLEYLVIVRNKKPTEEMLELAQESDMVVITSEYSMFKACGILYADGVLPLY